MFFKLAAAEEEYVKYGNLKRDDIMALLEWLRKQPHLPDITELQVILFYHSCCYQMEETKTTIDNYFTIRTLYSDLFGCATEDVIRRTLSTEFMRILPNHTPEGYIIMFFKLLDCRSENYENLNEIKLIIMVLTLHLHLFGACNRLVLVADMTGITLGHLTRMNLTGMKKMLFFLQEAAPIRIESLHLINTVPFADKLINILKPFMKKELYDSIRFHPRTIETLYEYVPKKYLPEEYGGENPSLHVLQDENIKRILENIEFFEWHDKQRVDESLRLGPRNNAIFNLDRSFCVI